MNRENKAEVCSEQFIAFCLFIGKLFCCYGTPITQHKNCQNNASLFYFKSTLGYRVLHNSMFNLQQMTLKILFDAHIHSWSMLSQLVHLYVWSGILL